MRLKSFSALNSKEFLNMHHFYLYCCLDNYENTEYQIQINWAKFRLIMKNLSKINQRKSDE